MQTATYRSLDELPLILRVEDLTTILGIGLNAAYNLIRQGTIRSTRVGNKILISRRAVEEFIASF